VLKMEQVFFMVYWKGEKAFYVSSTNWQGEDEYVCNHVDYWSSLWKEKNAKFEKFLAEDSHLYWLSRKMFHVWDNNHHLQAWWPYIDANHPNKPNWHIKVDSFVLDTTNGLIKLLTTMTNINKWVSIVDVYSFFHRCQMVLCWWLTFFFFAGSLKWTTWSYHLLMFSSAFNPSKWFHSTNSIRSFQMPNTRNVSIKSRRFGITSCRRCFLSLCTR
jgi:hypothetical protein